MKNKKYPRFAWLFVLLFALKINAQCPTDDLDNDGIKDHIEQLLAEKYAPEWRFSKQTQFPGDEIGLNSSNQNEGFDEHYPCSVDYLVYGNVAAGDGLPQLRYNVSGSPFSSVYAYVDFDDINKITTTPLNGLGFNNLTAIDPAFGSGCSEKLANGMAVCLSYKDGLKGEPNSFPTYFTCRRIGAGIALTYYLFSAYDDKREGFFGIEPADHRGDWERFTIVVGNVDEQNCNIENSTVVHLNFGQHEGIKAKITTDKLDQVRWVNGTHPKMYVARTSHAIYPQPGVLYNYRVDWWPDEYDDIFFGNGLIVQSWRRSGASGLINLGGEEAAMPATPWFKFKGGWGCDGSDMSPTGPACKWDDDVSAILDWDIWITEHPDGYTKKWGGHDFQGKGIYLDCNPKFSLDYQPDPAYGCDQIIDPHKTCGIAGNTGSDLPVWGSLQAAADGLPAASAPYRVGILPGKHPDPAFVNEPMLIRAIEGPATVGKN